MKKVKYLLGLVALVLLPLHVFAASGSMSYSYKSSGSNVVVTITAKPKSGAFTSYEATLALSENLTFKEASAGITFEEGKIKWSGDAVSESGTVIGTVTFTRSDRAVWSIKASGTSICEGEACFKAYNNQLTSTKSAVDGPIKNAPTSVGGYLGLSFVIIGAFAVYHIVNRKKIFNNI